MSSRDYYRDDPHSRRAPSKQYRSDDRYEDADTRHGKVSSHNHRDRGRERLSPSDILLNSRRRRSRVESRDVPESRRDRSREDLPRGGRDEYLDRRGDPYREALARDDDRRRRRREEEEEEERRRHHLQRRDEMRREEYRESRHQWRERSPDRQRGIRGEEGPHRRYRRDSDRSPPERRERSHPRDRSGSRRRKGRSEEGELEEGEVDEDDVGGRRGSRERRHEKPSSPLPSTSAASPEPKTSSAVKREVKREEDAEASEEKPKSAEQLRAEKEEELRRKRLHLREHCRVQLLDRRLATHLSEMHPTSALHELCTRLDWAAPNMTLAFECGPPMDRRYIFKTVVNGQTFMPAIAVDNKKDAKATSAWFAMQELGFVKKDPANPL